MVRRVRPTPGSQLALFTEWDYHAFVTDREGELVEIEANHRRHAVVEQSIAELSPDPQSSFVRELQELQEWGPGCSERLHRLGPRVGKVRTGLHCDSPPSGGLTRWRNVLIVTSWSLL